MTTERIKELINSSGLSNTDFARKIDLNPSIISHILSGRNKVSLQVIEQIASAFTNVNIDYLISGKGSLYDNVTNVKEEISKVNVGGFPMEGVRNASIPGSPPPIAESPVKNQESENKPVQKNKDLTSSSTFNHNIEQIVIFYKDGSFKAYRP